MKLGKSATSIERVSVRLTDVNGPRGGVDQRCRIKVVIQRDSARAWNQLAGEELIGLHVQHVHSAIGVGSSFATNSMFFRRQMFSYCTSVPCGPLATNIGIGSRARPVIVPAATHESGLLDREKRAVGSATQ
jgi:hypothetical protein